MTTYNDFNRIFSSYKLENSEKGYTIILYVNTSDSEFSKEFGSVGSNENDIVNINVIKFIKQNFKDIKISSIKIMMGSMLIATIAFSNIGQVVAKENIIPETYIVKSGDSLWKISNNYGVSIEEIRNLNKLSSDVLYIGQVLRLTEDNIITKVDYEYYKVISGDSLWKIAQKFGTTINHIKELNNMAGDVIFPGQTIKIKEIKTQGIMYIARSGDSLWKIANANNSTINDIIRANNLTNQNIYVGQELFVPTQNYVVPIEPKPSPTPSPDSVYNWPDITYIVQEGDTVSYVASKFNTTTANILKYNYMTSDEWLNAGEKIAISGYAPRTYTVTPGESSVPARTGKIVDWITEGQYILKRGTEFTVVDVNTGKQFKAKMLAGYNHADIEPLTSTDTSIMKSIFGTWQWNPRAVVIFINGMNIAGSLSGMPHSVDLLSGNNVTGHFDLYLKNSSSHSKDTSSAYIQQHRDMVMTAAGQK